MQLPRRRMGRRQLVRLGRHKIAIPPLPGAKSVENAGISMRGDWHGCCNFFYQFTTGNRRNNQAADRSNPNAVRNSIGLTTKRVEKDSVEIDRNAAWKCDGRPVTFIS